jgi:clan AA aspartic protease
MRTFRVGLEIGDPSGSRWQKVDALVDTGASYTWVPRELLEGLGVRPQFKREFLAAGDRVIKRDMGIAMVRWDGQALPTLVVFGDEGSASMLGAYTLEGFSLAVDPVNKGLVEVRALAMGFER